MITRLKLSNFKSHRDSELRFGELTVLTGSNSAGKTSVIHALLLLRQSYQKNRLWDGLELNGALCRIGVGGDALYRFADTNIMSVEVDDENRFRFSYEVGDDLGSSFLRKKSIRTILLRRHLARVRFSQTCFNMLVPCDCRALAILTDMIMRLWNVDRYQRSLDKARR